MLAASSTFLHNIVRSGCVHHCIRSRDFSVPMKPEIGALMSLPDTSRRNLIDFAGIKCNRIISGGVCALLRLDASVTDFAVANLDGTKDCNTADAYNACISNGQRMPQRRAA